MVTNGGNKNKLNETLHDHQLPADVAKKLLETAEDEATVNETAPDSAQLYIRNFKRVLDKGADKRAT